MESMQASYPQNLSISWTREDESIKMQGQFYGFLNKVESLSLLGIAKEITDESLVKELNKRIKNTYEYFVNKVSLFEPHEFERDYPYMTKIYSELISMNAKQQVK